MTEKSGFVRRAVASAQVVALLAELLRAQAAGRKRRPVVAPDILFLGSLSAAQAARIASGISEASSTATRQGRAD